jgi:hypothetical protein
MSRVSFIPNHSQSSAGATPAMADRERSVRPARLLSADRRRQLVLLLSGARRVSLAALLAGLAFLWSVPAHAQLLGPTTDQPSTSASSWIASSDGIVEVTPYAGAFIPTGSARTLLKNALLAGGQLSVRIVPQLAAVGTFGWTPNNDRTIVGAPTLDVYQYDLGIQARGAGWFQGDGWDFTPFAGVGGGGRTYNYRDLNLNTTTDVDGYGSVGADLGYGRLGLRIEGRDYLSQFHPLNGVGPTTNHNDVAISAGLRVRL